MARVSGKVVQFYATMCERYGESEERFFRGSGVDPASPGEWIGWDEFSLLARRLHSLCGSAETLRDLGEEIIASPDLEIVTLPMRMTVSPRTLFWASHQWAGPSIFPGLVKTFEELEDGILELSIRIPDDRRDSPEFFLLTEGMFRSLPTMMGLPPAVVDLERTDHLGLYRVRLPPSSTLWARLKRALTILFSLGRAGSRDPAIVAFNRLAESHEELQKQLRAAEEARAEAQRAYEEAEAARGLAEAGTRARDEFLKSVGHELRTPLVGILGSVDLLSEARLEASAKELLEAIRRSGERLLKSVEQIADFNRLQAGEMDLSEEQVEPVALARAVAMDLKNGERIRVEPCTDLPRAVPGDPEHLSSVLRQLYSNALKCSDEDVSVRIEREPEARRDLIRISVVDRGPGIPDGQLESLFSPFGKVEAAWTQTGDGLGLGLSISQALIELHGGTLGARNNPDRGASVWFTLPIRRPQA